MRKPFMLLTLFFFTGFCFAQVSVRLQQPPPNQLRATDIWKLTLINSGRNTLQVTLNGTLEVAGEGIIVEGNSKPISLPPGTKRITYDNVKTGNIDFKSGKWREAFTRTGNAPSGNYTICIHVKDRSGEEIGSDCIDQRVEITSSPTLITPADGETIAAEIQPLFTWLPPMPAPSGQITYRLKIVEILGNQSPEIAMQRNSAWFEKMDIRTTMLQYPLSAKKMEKSKKYAWSVQLINREGERAGESGGTTEAFMFEVEGEKGITKSLPVTNPTDSTSSVGGTGTAAVGDTIRAGLNGEFKVAVSQMTTETDGSLTGKGRVYVPWLLTNVAVEFVKIRIDSTKRLTSGGIVAVQSGSTSTSYQTYPLAWVLSLSNAPAVTNFVDGTVNWTNQKVDDIVSWVNNDVNVGQPFINYQSNIPPPPLPDNSLKMPFGLQFSNGNHKLVITEFLFKPNESKINFLAQTEFRKSGTVYKLGFIGKYFIIHPGSIEFANGRVELAEDFTIPNTSVNPKMKFTFKKGTTSAGCYIQWADSGIVDIGLGLEVKFTRDWLLPIPTSTDSVKATISGNGRSMQDILLSGSLPHCEIVGTNGFKVLADSISLDLSDVRNPSSMHFPKNFPNDSTVLWQGFYIKSFGLTLPDTWKTGANLNPPSVTASDVIIDDMGLTTKIKAVNVFDLQSGRVADLSASLDTVEVSIISSSLVSGTAKGKLVLPISDVTAQNSLKYTATFAQVSGANSFQIVIVPFQPISADVLKGKMTLSPTSNITATKSPNLLTLSINLNGTFNWDNPTLNITDTTTATGASPVRKKGINGIKMELGFENVGLTYTNNSSANTNTLAFNYGTWSFASPQKRLANFPVTIKKVYYKSLTTVPPTDQNMKELVRGALMIDIVANLTEDIGGTTTVGAAFAVEFDKTAIKFTPKYKGVFIDSIAVHADLSAVKINGSLVMYDNDPKFGDGFKATLGVTFTAVSLQVDALAQFGNTTYNYGQYYRYWRVEADAKFSPGIPFLTGVGFYGFGGGAYYNMKAIPKPNPTVVPGAYTFEPQKGFKGLKVSTTIGTLPKVETFNADVSLTAQFNNNNGLDLIYFTGDFWLATKLTDRPAAKILGSVAVSYNFPDKIFFMGAGLLVNVPPAITTPAPIGFVMNINGRTNKWYFKSGIPTATNTVNVFGISLYSYLMFGNDIPAPNGFTSRFVSNYSDATGSAPNNNNVGSGGVGTNTATGKGIATGIGIEFSKNISKHLYEGSCRNWYIGGNVMAGAELNLALMHQTGCVGINGYRASGNIGLYGSVEATITGTSFKSYCNNKSISLFKIKSGAWLVGKFPNPEYVAGSLTADINLFNGLCTVSYNQSFEKGTNCYGTEVASADAPQEDKAADLKNKLIQYVAPNTRYNFPVASTINAKYALVPDQVFDVAENQGDGTIRNRTFKLVITRSLEVQNTNGTWAAKTLQSKANNIGEYQYYIKAPLSGTLAQASNQLSPAVATSLNTNSGSMLIASNGSFQMNNIPSPLPPPPPPNYPNPIPNPVNHLVGDMEYRFIVTATLKELSGGIWNTAKTRANIPVAETKTVLFRTGGMPLAQVNTAAPKSK